MGLDMYLSRRPKNSEDVGYWRKANAIHKWFVDNVQDGVDNCAEYVVYKSQLELLRDTCKRVLEDHSLAEELLPTESGFFFGSTEYNKWYFDDLETTVDIIDKVLAETDFYNYDITYQSSW